MTQRNLYNTYLCDSGKMLESPNYLASVAAGELVPQLTLNRFSSPEEEWSWWE